MRKPIMIPFICLIILVNAVNNPVGAQTSNIINYITIKPQTPIDKSSWCTVQEAPCFPGGIVAWTKYLTDSTNYPELAIRKQLATDVKIQFVISKEGFVKEAICLDTMTNLFTKEAIRVIEASPKWNAAKQSGRAISYRMIQGFHFEWDPPTKPNLFSCDSSSSSIQKLSMLL